MRLFYSFFTHSAITIAQKIKEHPIPIFKVKRSRKKIELNKIPKTDSKLKNKDASED